MTTSISCSLSVGSWMAVTISGGSAARSTPRSSVASRRSLPSCGSVPARWSGASPCAEAARFGRSGATGDLQVTDGGRDEARFGDANEGFLHEQRDRGDLPESRLLESTIGRCLVGSHGCEDAVIRPSRGIALGLPGDRSEAEVDERREVDLRPAEQAQVVRLILAGDTGLDEAIEAHA